MSGIIESIRSSFAQRVNRRAERKAAQEAEQHEELVRLYGGALLDHALLQLREGPNPDPDRVRELVELQLGQDIAKRLEKGDAEPIKITVDEIMDLHVKRLKERFGIVNQPDELTA